MKKNVILYILLVFLVIVNCFFLFTYLGAKNGPPGDQRNANPTQFIVKELNFNKSQMAEFDKLTKLHRDEMRNVLEETKLLKDELFKQITLEVVSKEKVDSLINLIGNQEAKQEQLRFYHLRSIQKICDMKQKERFEKIVNDALHKGRSDERQDGPPPPRH